MLEMFLSFVMWLGSFTGTKYEVWHAPAGQGELRRFSVAADRAVADKVAAALRTAGGTAEVRPVGFARPGGGATAGGGNPPKNPDPKNPDPKNPPPKQGQAFGVIDMEALIRTDPPEGKSTGRVVPYGTLVEVLEEQIVGGRTLVKVQKKGDPSTVYGWTSKTNLGSAKEFDPTMAPATQLDLTRLTGLRQTMAGVYNTRGKYLEEQAAALGVSVHALAAVLKVESGGRAFSPDGRTIIRFENHVFYDQWGQNNAATFNQHFKFDPAPRRWLGHLWRREATGAWVSPHSSQSSEYDVQTFARTLDDTGALKAASYGIGQVMGFNHSTLGYATVQEMVTDFDRGIKPQLDGMIAFIKANKKCMDGLKAGDYVKFAEGYNGSGQAAAYGKLIEDAANAYLAILPKNPPKLP